jgi:hypothetical protein
MNALPVHKTLCFARYAPGAAVVYGPHKDMSKFSSRTYALYAVHVKQWLSEIAAVTAGAVVHGAIEYQRLYVLQWLMVNASTWGHHIFWISICQSIRVPSPPLCIWLLRYMQGAQTFVSLFAWMAIKNEDYEVMHWLKPIWGRTSVTLPIDASAGMAPLARAVRIASMSGSLSTLKYVISTATQEDYRWEDVVRDAFESNEKHGHDIVRWACMFVEPLGSDDLESFLEIIDSVNMRGEYAERWLTCCVKHSYQVLSEL